VHKFLGYLAAASIGAAVPCLYAAHDNPSATPFTWAMALIILAVVLGMRDM
jgi:hypothetical protein